MPKATVVKRINLRAAGRFVVGGTAESYDDTTEEGQQLTAGADLNISTAQVVQRAGNKVLRFDGADALLAQYNRDATGLAAALAGAASGDIVEIPAGTIAASVTVPAGVTLRGMSRANTIIAGLVTLGDLSALENLTVLRQVDQVGVLAGVTVGASGTAILQGVKVRIENNSGPAYAVLMDAGGNINAYETELIASIGTDGYAAYVTSGTFNHYSGRAVGSTAGYPYYL